MQSLHIVAFISELNLPMFMKGDIGNAYLESFTYEKVYFIADPEFGPPEGHLLIIVKSLYGLHSSGICFHEKLANTLHCMGFNPVFWQP